MADIDPSTGHDPTGLRHYARGLLDAGQTATQAVGALMVKGLDYGAADRLVSELLTSPCEPPPPSPVAASPAGSAHPGGAAPAPPEPPIACYRSANGRLVLAALPAGLLVLIAGLTAFAGLTTNRQIRDGSELAMYGVCLAVILAGLAAIRGYLRRWSEELTVYPSGLVRRYNGSAEAAPWSAVAGMEVDTGGGLLEWVLLQFEKEIPRLVIQTAAGGRWVYRFNMQEIEHLCQVVPAVWTAHRAGMR